MSSVKQRFMQIYQNKDTSLGFIFFTVHFDSPDLIHTNQCTFSYNDVLVF